MNWKLIAGMALTAVLIGGCNSSSSPSSSSNPTDPKGGTTAEKTIVGMVFDSGGRGDKSFNDSAWAGLERAQKELGIEPKTVDSRQISDYEKNLEILAKQNVPLVVAVGISMKSAVEKVAPKYPNTKFALVDEMVDSPNVRGLKFKEEEGSFLAGYLAGLMTKTNKLGFVGGMEIPLIKRFEAGFAAGAKTANAKVEMLPAKYTGDWNNVDLGKQTAKTLYSQGADIIYHAAGGSGKGVFEAAKEESKYAIGVDSDQDDIAPGLILTSMMKRVDEAVFQSVKDFKDGKFSSGEVVYDLKSNGVGLSPMTHTKDKIGAENLKKIDEIKAKIISGEIKVPSDMDAYETYVKGLPK
jgi:basic membrane protein A and related proteins